MNKEVKALSIRQLSKCHLTAPSMTALLKCYFSEDSVLNYSHIVSLKFLLSSEMHMLATSFL